MVYLIIGQCGSGKTYAIRELAKKFGVNKEDKCGLYRFIKNDEIIILGVYDGSVFEGSDRLSMSIMINNEEFKAYSGGYKFIIAEGDRFTNSTFVNDFSPYIIKVTDDGSKGRRLRGTEQSDRHIKSINTRVNNIKADIELKTSDDVISFLSNILTTGVHPEKIERIINKQENLF